MSIGIDDENWSRAVQKRQPRFSFWDQDFQHYLIERELQSVRVKKLYMLTLVPMYISQAKLGMLLRSQGLEKSKQLLNDKV